MNVEEAIKRVKEIDARTRDLDSKTIKSEEEKIELVENLQYLISETKKGHYAAWLGNHYYEIKEYFLAQVYYEMAYEMGYKLIYNTLGSIWYSGGFGWKDYEKAFKCFSIVSSLPVGENLDYGEIDEHTKSESVMKRNEMCKNGYKSSGELQKLPGEDKKASGEDEAM